MPPLFYKRGIKSKGNIPSLRGASANIPSLRGALATKQSHSQWRNFKARFIGHVVRYASLAMTIQYSQLHSPVIARSVSQYPVIARSVSDEAISLLQQGELKTKTPSSHCEERQRRSNLAFTKGELKTKTVT